MFCRFCLIALSICLFTPFTVDALGQATAKPESLEAKIKPIAQTHQGKIALAIKHAETGETYILNGDDVYQTASLIKLAVMVTAYHWSDEKKLDLNKMLTLTQEDKVVGSGVLTDHFSVGMSLSVRDTIRLMIRYSDNTATNMVLDQVGLKGVNDWTMSKGLTETRINGKVYKGTKTTLDPERLKKYQLGSTTPNETIKLLEMIDTGKAASVESCQLMIDHLKTNDDRDLLLKYLPEEFKAAHKTGATNKVRTDAGIFYIPTKADKKKLQKVYVCVLTNENEDVRWLKENTAEIVMGKIGKAVVEHFEMK